MRLWPRAQPDTPAVLAYCVATVSLLCLTTAAPADFLAGLLRPRMLSLHLVLELFAISIASFVVVVSWHTFGERRDARVNALITGFTVVAALDLMHALTYRGMPAFITTASTPQAIYYWLTGRTAEVLTLAAIAFDALPRASRGKALAAGLLVALCLVVYGSSGLPGFPATFIDGVGVTPFKADWEYLLCAAQLLLAVALRRRAVKTHSPELTLLALGSFTMGLGELSFTAYVRPSDFQNIAGHIYKVAAYVCLYRATFLASLHAPYAALAASEARVSDRDATFRSIGANLPSTVLFQSVVGLDGERRFTQVGQAVERICGLSVAEMLADGASLRRLVIAEDRDVFEQSVRRAIDGDAGTEVQFRLRRPDGVLRRMVLSVAARHLPDGRIALDGSLSDITERAEAEAERLALEQQLRDAQKMESIGTLASGIAHDFNNVVGAILGNTALAEQDLDAGRTEQVRTGLGQIGVAARRARELVRQIMTFGRKQALELRAQPLEPIVDEALALLRATLPAGVVVRKAVVRRELCAAVDATQLQQVLLNLCTNAWHAMDAGRGGRIEVGLDGVELRGYGALVSGLAPGDYANLWVEDDGRGMDEATRERVFEPFFTTKPVGQGTGLGLAVVHGIVASHKGVIRLRSELGVGTRFDIYLPLSTPARTPERPAPAPARRLDTELGYGCTALLLDDDEVMALMTERLLESAGFKVLRFSDFDDALDAVRDIGTPVDLLVTDYNMPGCNGLQFVQRARGLRAQLPAVISSGFVPAELRQEARALTDVQVVEKQAMLEELMPAIERALGSGLLARRVTPA